MQDSLIIATSLSPTDDLAVQPTAIKSWIGHGCTIISVNTEEEINALSPAFPNVEFVCADRTAEQFAGRPVPYIYDLLQAAKAAADDDQTIGVANADIFLRPAPGLASFLASAAKGAVILGPRVDVPHLDSFEKYVPENEPTYSIGYDYFLMSRDVADAFNDSPFAIGMPFWDYWLPLTAYLAGHQLKTLNSPVALHISHETRWNDTIYLFFHALITYALEQSKSGSESSGINGRQLGFFRDLVSHVYSHVFENGTASENGNTPNDSDVAALANFFDRFQEAAVHTIKSNAELIHFDAG